MQKINSAVKAYSFHDDETLLEDIKEYPYAVLYFESRVEMKKICDIDSLEKLLELRAFGKTGELRVINSNGQWRGRIRTDDEGDCVSVDYLDETHLLWGKPKKSNSEKREGYTYLTEARGTSLSVPIKVPENGRAFVIIRNYLNAEGFVFDDFRMVDLIGKEVKENGE